VERREECGERRCEDRKEEERERGSNLEDMRVKCGEKRKGGGH
jgi:hypothetical protein